MHNSNRDLVQVSLSGEVLPEEKYSVLGFVPIDVLGLSEDIWFTVLSSQQVSSITLFLSESRQSDW